MRVSGGVNSHVAEEKASISTEIFMQLSLDPTRREGEKRLPRPHGTAECIIRRKIIGSGRLTAKPAQKTIGGRLLLACGRQTQPFTTASLLSPGQELRPNAQTMVKGRPGFCSSWLSSARPTKPYLKPAIPKLRLLQLASLWKDRELNV